RIRGAVPPVKFRHADDGIVLNRSVWPEGLHRCLNRGSMRRLGLLLLPEFSNLGWAGVPEPLFVANWLAQRMLFEWRTVSVDGKPVRASNGALLAVDGDLAGVKECASV